MRPFNLHILAILVFVFATQQITAQNPEATTFNTEGLKIGDTAPIFTGMDQNNVKINSDSLLNEGSIILVFFRGEWCKYCNRHLYALTDSLSFILEKGAKIIAVSPQLPSYRDETIEKTGASFPILYDKDYQIMKDYKVAFEVDDKTLKKYKMFGINIAKTNGDTNEVLPVPATYIIDTNRKIKYVHFDPAYKNRSTVKKLLSYL